MIAPLQIFKGFLMNTGSPVTLYTIPVSLKNAIIKEILVCNTDTVYQTFTITMGGKTTHNSFGLQAGETRPLPLATTLLPGDIITGGASVDSKITCIISGLAYS